MNREEHREQMATSFMIGFICGLAFVMLISNYVM